MELLFRIAAAAVCALLCALLIRRTNPELAALVTVAAVVVMLFLALPLAEGIGELRALMTESFGLNESALRPLLKCVAASVVTKLTADLCRDASQAAAASAVELAGTLCALGVVMPLLIGVLRMAVSFL